MTDDNGDNKQIVPRDEKGRILKGYSGNPKGRPKVGMTLAEVFRSKLEEKDENGICKRDALYNILVENAEKGNMKAMEILMERSYGKSKAFLEISTKNEFELDWDDEGDDEGTDKNDEESDVIDGEVNDEEDTYQFEETSSS